jgi:hypothetical protein
MKTLFTQKIYTFISSVGKHFMLNQIQFYLVKLFTYLLNRYPFLYKATDYLFTTFTIFNLYLYSIVLKLHDRFKNKYPISYSIFIYIYSEYLTPPGKATLKTKLVELWKNLDENIEIIPLIRKVNLAKKVDLNKCIIY